MRNTIMAILLSCAVVVSGCLQLAHEEPELHFDMTVASDFRDLANETWHQFILTFSARTDCFGDVTLRTDPALESRAAYNPETATTTVRVPGTPAFLQAALVHEWAHHVEFQCDAHKALRPEILSSLNLSPDTQWHIGHEWEDTPSEHYAEAVVELVLGDHPLPTKIRVNRKVVAILKDWAEED